MDLLKKITLIVCALFVAALASTSAEASIDRIGDGYAYNQGYINTGVHTSAYNSYRSTQVIALPNPQYNYGSAPRAGGWFGGGAGWLTGLRAPSYTAIAPTHYSSFDRPRCYNCYNTGYYGHSGGSSAMNYRIRINGGFA